MRQTGRLLMVRGGEDQNQISFFFELQNQISWNDFVTVINTKLETPKTLRDIITLRPKTPEQHLPKYFGSTIG